MQQFIIETSEAPAPIGPYSQAVNTGGLLFVSGQIALDPASGLMVQDSVADEAHQVMKNIHAILRAAGVDFSHVVKTTIFLSDMSFFSEVNSVYASYLSGSFPARETVAVKGLPKDARVEISVIARA